MQARTLETATYLADLVLILKEKEEDYYKLWPANKSDTVVTETHREAAEFFN